VTALVVALVVIANLVSASLPLKASSQAAPGGMTEAPCADVRDAALEALHEMSPVGTRAVRLSIENAFVLFRLGKRI
jgi:hypothetical protein